MGAHEGGLLHRVLHGLLQLPELVGVVPVCPHSESDGLLRLEGCVLENPLLALLDELCDAVLLYVPLRLEAELPLHLDLDPEALAVEAVLVADLVAPHELVAGPEVLVGPPPGVVDPHGVVGGDGAVDEAPVGPALLHLDALLEGPGILPELEYLPLEPRQVRLAVYLFEGHRSNSPPRFTKNLRDAWLQVSPLCKRLNFAVTGHRWHHNKGTRFHNKKV